MKYRGAQTYFRCCVFSPIVQPIPARLAVNESTVRRYLDLMTGVFMVRQLTPWFEYVGKRQVKAPKVYLRDTGLLHTFLGINTQSDLENHPKVGASWEGYAIEEIRKAFRPDEAYYWATHRGAEIDMVLFKSGPNWCRMQTR